MNFIYKKNAYYLVFLIIFFVFISIFSIVPAEAGSKRSQQGDNNLENSFEIVEGFIKSVILSEKIIIIKGNRYQLTEDCEIIRNGLVVPLKSCGPVRQKVYQWARAEIKDNKIVTLKVSYKVIEGFVQKIDKMNDCLSLKIFKTPELEGGVSKFSLPPRIKAKFSLKKGDRIIAAVGKNRILYIFRKSS